MKEYPTKYSQIHYFRVEFMNIGRVRQYDIKSMSREVFYDP